MSTFTQFLYHIVFATKDRTAVLRASHREDLFKFIWGILQQKDCHLYRIGGVDDHIHILCAIHPSIAVSNLVKDIKVATSQCIKAENMFPGFDGWQDGYGAFTCSWSDRDRLIEYIKNQEEHHRKLTFRDELVSFLNEAGINFDPKYLP
jgi:putative transposase